LVAALPLKARRSSDLAGREAAAAQRMASASTCEARRRRERGTPFSSSHMAERLAEEATWDDTATTAVKAMEGAVAVEDVEGAAVVEAVEGATVVEAVEGATVVEAVEGAAEAEARVSATMEAVEGAAVVEAVARAAAVEAVEGAKVGAIAAAAEARVSGVAEEPASFSMALLAEEEEAMESGRRREWGRGPLYGRPAVC
jgi:hypothetical protein